MDTTANNAYYNLACIYSIRKDTAKSLQYLAMSIRHGYDDFEHIKIDTDLDNIRETAGFKELMEKNFPNYYKSVSYTHLDVYKRQVLQSGGWGFWLPAGRAVWVCADGGGDLFTASVR